MNNKIRPIALYLPQYHPVKENDEWWGKGFTEWRNVVAAESRFEGHYQPHLPSDLGFYDLRVSETRDEQARLARENGIYGFCYYHYWFNGKRILERPFQEVFESGKPDFPFCLCWANENWTRAWDGSEKEILLKQDYSFEDDRNHIKYLLPYFKDERYIKVDGKPLFIFYKPDLFPDIQKTIEIFREEAINAGLKLYICCFERWNGLVGDAVNSLGFDAAIEFQPLSKSLRKFVDSKNVVKQNNILPKRIKNLVFRVKSKIKSQKKTIQEPVDLHINYSEFVDFDLLQDNSNYKLFPGVCPMWDNSSRRKNQNAIIFKESTPQKFQYWIKEKIRLFKPFSKEENFIFINAWNEWAEGNHLEPCMKWGDAYLKAVKDQVTTEDSNL